MIKFSFYPNPFPNSLALNGANLQAGTKIYGYYEPFVLSEAAYSFWDNGTKVGNNESQAPVEAGNGNGWIPAPGNHKLEVKNKSGNVLETINFTVGTIVEPPIPPTDPNLKTITLKLKEDNSEVAKIVYDETKVERVG